jgi:hypothetical protein
MTKKITALSGSGFHKKSAIINAAFSKAPNTNMGIRPTLLTIEPQVIDPIASAAP